MVAPAAAEPKSRPRRAGGRGSKLPGDAGRHKTERGPEREIGRPLRRAGQTEFRRPSLRERSATRALTAATSAPAAGPGREASRAQSGRGDLRELPPTACRVTRLSGETVPA